MRQLWLADVTGLSDRGGPVLEKIPASLMTEQGRTYCDQSATGELKDAGLNIRTFHIIERRDDFATAAVATDDQERAKTALASRYTVL